MSPTMGDSGRPLFQELGLLESEVAARFGNSLPGALKFQVEMMRRRLIHVADRQAGWFADGWRMVYSEWTPAVAASLAVDNAGMELSGRIDRIDYNERLGAWAVLDYKISTLERYRDRNKVN